MSKNKGGEGEGIRVLQAEGRVWAEAVWQKEDADSWWSESPVLGVPPVAQRVKNPIAAAQVSVEVQV